MNLTATHIQTKEGRGALAKEHTTAKETSHCEGEVPVTNSSNNQPVSYYDAMIAEIHHRIDAAGMTRQDVAAGLGITTNTLRRKLNGQTALMLEDIRRFAVVLGCRMSDLTVSPNNDVAPACTGHSDCA